MAWGIDGGEFEGVRRGLRCLEADFLKPEGEANGDGAGLLDGQFMLYPPLASSLLG